MPRYRKAARFNLMDVTLEKYVTSAYEYILINVMRMHTNAPPTKIILGYVFGRGFTGVEDGGIYSDGTLTRRHDVQFHGFMPFNQHDQIVEIDDPDCPAR